MIDIVLTNKFKKDYALAKKRGCDLDLLNDVVTELQMRHPLDSKYHDHSLSGEYEGYRECHIKPDWLLVYRIDEDELCLILFRTGTHSDLF